MKFDYFATHRKAQFCVEIEEGKKRLDEAGEKYNDRFEMLDDNGEVRIESRMLTPYEIRKKVYETAEILDLRPYLDKLPKELSGGMKQRIGLLQTLLTDASLFLLDEPFNAIDINALNSIKLYIWEYLIKSNKTMIFITHNIDQALLLSDRILIMRSPTELLEIKPTKEYCSLSPDERIDTSEYKKLFFEIVENLKYEK